MDIQRDLSKLGLMLGDPEKYAEDMGYFKGKPEAVVIARGVEDVRKTLEIAREKAIKVTPWGKGTSVTGAAITNGGILIDLSNMNKILEFSDEDWTIHVEAGVVLDDINKFLKPRGFFFPPDPASSFMCSVGGATSEGSGGMHCVKYGTMKDWVLAVKVVLPNGEVVKIGEPLQKNRVGYDLVHLMVGSEGTLGIITEVWLKVIPIPDYKVLRVLAFFNKEDDISRTIINLRKNRIQPEIAEYMDSKVLEALKKSFNIETEGVGALLIDIPEFSLEKLKESLHNSILVKIAENEDEKEELYKARSFAYLAIKATSKYSMSEDIVVPVSKLPKVFKKIRELEGKYQISSPILGHIGDGNLHPVITYDDDSKDRAMEFFKELCEYVIDEGGSVTGEHGVGIQKRELAIEQIKKHNGDEVLRLMKKIKDVFDDKGIMNPTKQVV
ncbi:FAD-binding oxidoreductase [Sulfuracidifex metallicus]|nr:FAD-binding oxidoreductase [Sulfuracidifex metallicus]WOE51053.1 FAD-binding oxidoreductase [Sulfuracidifex metallicus DSM 6482 = JCM 9184]